MRFLHSADWQIGARFRRFGSSAQRLREVRLETFRRALEVARVRDVDAFLIAGDLFEDHQVEPGAIRGIYEAIRDYPSVPVFVLPGNHDPASGPAAIWGRAPFVQPLPNLKIFREAEAVQFGDHAWLLASPLTQKRSTVDPSLRFVEMAALLPTAAIKVGITHGALAIGGRHAPDDFPIALDAASRAGLDYVALGHWHSSYACDDGRLVMPGTPEPTDFGENGAGHLHLVTIDQPGSPPRMEAIKVAGMTWRHVVCDGVSVDEAISQVQRELAAHQPVESLVMRVTLKGTYPAEERARAIKSLEELLAECAVVDIRDETEAETTSEDEA
ncbi:MAG: metallophosphoesterase family protein [Chthoniobacteraceae bacterium]